MYSGNKYYRNVEEYVQDLTGYKKKDDDAFLQVMAALGIFIAIMWASRTLAESLETESVLLFLSVLLLLPAALIACTVFFFKSYNNDKKKERDLYNKVLWVITRLPVKSQCMGFDQVLASLIVRNFIDQKTIERLRKLRLECYDDKISSSQQLDKLADYAAAIDEERARTGIVGSFDDEIAQLRKEADETRRAEKKLQIQKRNKQIREIRDMVISDYPELKKQIKLDSKKLELLERKYKEIRKLPDDCDLYTDWLQGIEERFLRFVEGYFLLSTASTGRGGIKEAVEKLIYDESDVNSVMNKVYHNKHFLGLDLRPQDAGYSEHLADSGAFYILTFMLVHDMLTEPYVSTCSLNSFSDCDYDDYDYDDYDYDSDDESYMDSGDEPYPDDDFDNDRFGYDSEAFDFDMDGFDDLV